MENNEAKQKAVELIEWFTERVGNSFFARQCAIKVCDEFISNGTPKQLRFYKQVKKEAFYYGND